MADTFHITGFNVYFRGFHVATLETRAPETVMADVVEALHDVDPELIHTAAELAAEYDDGYRDGAREADDEIKQLKETLAAEQRYSDDLRSQIAALESMLKAAAP